MQCANARRDKLYIGKIHIVFIISYNSVYTCKYNNLYYLVHIRIYVYLDTYEDNKR